MKYCYRTDSEKKVIHQFQEGAKTSECLMVVIGTISFSRKYSILDSLPENARICTNCQKGIKVWHMQSNREDQEKAARLTAELSAGLSKTKLKKQKRKELRAKTVAEKAQRRADKQNKPMLALPVAGYWRKVGAAKGYKWHIGNTAASTYCQVEQWGGEFSIVEDRPEDHSICELCRREMAPKQDWQVRHEIYQQDFYKTTAFLETYEWRKLRMEALTKYGAKCMCCNATREHGVRIHVDHIKPRRLFPELALTLSNLQILCEDCNHGKGNWDQTDWRPREEDNLPDGAIEHLRDMKH